MTKTEIRKLMLKRRDELNDYDRERASCLITERILGHQWFYRSDTLLCFVSYGSEINTHEILSEAVRLGKKVYVPRICGEEMRFYRFESLDKLIPGYRGIPEPSTGELYCYNEKDAEHTLLLMPGVAFDDYRNRLGYGKGFYDRFLRDKEGLWVRSIAIGFRCQKADPLPAEEYDIKPYQVILV